MNALKEEEHSRDGTTFNRRNLANRKANNYSFAISGQQSSHNVTGSNESSPRKNIANRLNFSVDYTVGATTQGRNSPRLAGIISDGTSGSTSTRFDTNRLMRSMALSNPISPERQLKAEERYV